MNRTATQLAGNASSIFEAWLDLKRQTSQETQNQSSRRQAMSGRPRRSRDMDR